MTADRRQPQIRGRTMKAVRAVVAACAILAAASSVAQADLILIQPNGTAASTVAQSFTDIGAQGFGNAPRMLTMQVNVNTAVETGNETPVDVEHGDAID